MRAVAGGLGERLGYSGIKVALPTETSTGKCYLALFIEHILALQVIRRPCHQGSVLVACILRWMGAR